MLQGNMRLYGCGGFGLNIASNFDTATGTQEPGHSVPHPVYIDTSMSNIRDDLRKENVFILDGVDGSGKIRKENHEAITKHVKAILQAHPPMDFNVVIFSASGGSGSVFGPLIVAELLARKLPVVGIVVGSDESAITAQNTLNTLKSLESIAQKAELPVVICYEHNEMGLKRSDVDRTVRGVVGYLSVLASRQNMEMDTRDIANWVQFNKSTSVKPRLALMDVYFDNEEVEAASMPVSIASLYESPEAETLSIIPEYHTAGYPRCKLPDFKVAHFVITIDGVPVIVKKMQQRIHDLSQQRQSRVDHDSFVESSDEKTKDGLIL